ncbi:MAG TPA: alkene reductase, partial [Kiloniellales bacterium]|nr:alkene reductase [Kiloniellales bacterium]
EYYAQRATAGLIVTEATQISQEGQGYVDTPGIHSAVQVAGWREVTEAVHRAGGTIVLQLWHVGRVSHPSFQPGGGLPVAPSAIRPPGQIGTRAGKQDFVVPRALDRDELPRIVGDFAQGARNALIAGFDGVEIHGAHGYLLDAFLRDSSNRRQDGYGGSIENRLRFPLEVVDAVTAAVGAGRTAIRLSPVSPIYGMSDSDPTALFSAMVDALDRRGLAYVHVVEGATGTSRETDFDFKALRRRFGGAWIANNLYDRAMASAVLETGDADLVAFGRPYIANPDLVERLRSGAPLASANPATIYGGGAEGYTDYPPLQRAAA